VVDPESFVDLGLMNHPTIKNRSDAKQYAGKMKVPTLRNIAVTAPYMHNGVFKDLKTVVEFYDKYVNKERTINPETGKKWAEPEVAISKGDLELLQQGRPMNERKVEALVAFMKLLTDKRYEYLLE
jgi:cytochrome c peroxidase